MPTPTRGPLDLRALMEAVEAAPPVAAADVISEVIRDAIGAQDVSFLIADYSGESLIRLDPLGRDGTDGDGDRGDADTVALSMEPYGRVLAEQQVQVTAAERGSRVFAPVTSRGEAIGVLELALPAPPDAQTLASISTAAHALAFIVIANRRFTDLFEWGQRTLPLSLEAEIQHRLLPTSYTLEGGHFTLAGWLEPAGDVGGDTFDFSVERETLHLSVTDAMGHTLGAALLATVLVGALRNARRRSVSLAEQARIANDALARYAADGAFVTGQLARIDLASGIAEVVNAGHPAPIRVRDGRAERVVFDADPPFGISTSSRYAVQEVELRPGDRWMFLTDGMLERNAKAVDAMSVVAAGRHLHPREAVQALTRAVVDACGGHVRDDATVLCLDWHGEGRAVRRSAAGADW